MVWVSYTNGNYDVLLNTINGTKIRYNDLDNLTPARPESIDVKISNDCEHNCAFCHEMSYSGGLLAWLENVELFAKSLPPYIEIALGGGNLMKNIEHTETCLKIFKQNKAIVSITIRQDDFVKNIDIIDKWLHQKLIYGIGISLLNATDNRFWNLYSHYKTAIIHTIAGLLTINDIYYLMQHHARILILGYKHIGRGIDYYDKNGLDIESNINYLREHINKIIKKTELCSFDNLALDQLNVQEQIPQDTWETYYMGDDGSTTFYIDLVAREFAESSSSTERYLIKDPNCMAMFNFIQLKRKK